MTPSFWWYWFREANRGVGVCAPDGGSSYDVLVEYGAVDVETLRTPMSAERRASECETTGLRSLEWLEVDMFARMDKADDLAYRVC